MSVVTHDTQSELAGIVNKVQEATEKTPRGKEPVQIELLRIVQRFDESRGELVYEVSEIQTVSLPATHPSEYPARLGSLTEAAKQNPAVALQDLADKGRQSELYLKSADKGVFEIARRYAAERRLTGQQCRWLSTSLMALLISRKGATLSMRSM